MTPAASVVIPTFNGASRLPALLSALSMQHAPEGGFEVIVVDNNSTDGTADVVRNDPSAAALRARGVECRLAFEPRQGAAFARIRGATEARTPILCFLDDDNLPADPDYLTAGAAALSDPGVGLLISRTEPLWERKPPPSVERRCIFFALTGDPANASYLGDAPIDFGPGGSIAPTNGAGTWVRRDVFLSVIRSRAGDLLPGRQGEGIGTGEDLEVGILVGKAGFRRLYVPQLRLKHFISSSRLATVPLWRLLVGNLRGYFTLEARYGVRDYGLLRRARGGARLAWALFVAPAVVLLRRDGWREAVLITAQRWAELRGPWGAYVGSGARVTANDQIKELRPDRVPSGTRH